MADWLENLLRSISLFLDRIIYPLIGTVYELLYDIANVTIFNEKIFDAFNNKIYALLGIFMLFKLSFSILTYIINPDDFTDKNKGFTKVISNVAITLLLLTFTPMIFNKAMELQTIILRDNIIQRIFSTQQTPNNTHIGVGDKIAYETFSSFYFIETSEDVLPECLVLKESDWDDTRLEKCVSSAFADTGKKDFYKNILLSSHLTSDVKMYMNRELAIAENSDGDHVITYMSFVSTAIGVVIVLLLLVFCFDVAVRSIKLGFLQMLAPIPIMSRLDPKKGKDVFDKWVKSCVSTYLDLFIRLLAISFSIMVINIVISNKGIYNVKIGVEQEVSGFVKVFIILGALLFAKQLPKLLEELTGYKMEGKFSLNPIKKLNQTGAPSMLAVAGAGLAGGVANAYNAYQKREDFAHPVAHGIFSTLGGVGSSFGRGARNFVKNKGEKPGEIFTKAVTESSRARRLREGGYGIDDKIMDYATTIAGVDYDTGTTSKLKNEINAQRELARNARDEENQARNELRDFRTKLGAQKSQEIQRLLSARKFETDEYGKVQRNDDGIIKYQANTNLPDTYSAYIASVPPNAQSLTATEYADLKAYLSMIDRADGTAFMAEKAVKKAEEKSGLAKPGK